MKILLVDDDYTIFSLIIKIAGEELIETEPALSPEIALQIIKNHPEADFILLDGCFKHFNVHEIFESNYEIEYKKYSCLSIIEFLNQIEKEKIICFATEPDRYKDKLTASGIKHFPGKAGDFIACIQGRCSC